MNQRIIYRWGIPTGRRLTQLIGLALLALLPVMALYTHYKAAHSLHDLTADSWRTRAVQGIDRVVGKNKSLQAAIEHSQGTIWSARVSGVSLTDPLAGAETILSSRSFYGPMLWSLVIPVAVTVLLGRVFCGWLCPMNTLLEIVDKGRWLLGLAEIRERDVKFSLRNKYLVLAVVLGTVAVTGVPFIAMIYPPAIMSREMHLFVFGSTIGIGVYLIMAICAVELFVSKRWWCRYICPGGALYSLLGRFRVVRVVRNEKNCVQCGECVRVCQFDLRPMLVQITGMECTNCGSCVKACNDDALRLVWVMPRPQRLSRSNKPSSGTTALSAELHDISAPGSLNTPATLAGRKGTTLILLIVLVATATFSPSVAQGHHILGLPHYSYKENYPQAPTLEYPASTGPFDVLMTSFPGHPVPGERTTIAFYIKDRNSNTAYELPVSLRVLQTKTFGANKQILEPTVHEPSTHQHKFFVTFPEDGEFIAELTMEVEGKTEVIPFLMVAGQPSAATSVVVAAVGGLGLFLLAVRAIRIKRKRQTLVRVSSMTLE